MKSKYLSVSRSVSAMLAVGNYGYWKLPIPSDTLEPWRVKTMVYILLVPEHVIMYLYRGTSHIRSCWQFLGWFLALLSFPLNIMKMPKWYLFSCKMMFYLPWILSTVSWELLSWYQSHRKLCWQLAGWTSLIPFGPVISIWMDYITPLLNKYMLAKCGEISSHPIYEYSPL